MKNVLISLCCLRTVSCAAGSGKDLQMQPKCKSVQKQNRKAASTQNLSTIVFLHILLMPLDVLKPLEITMQKFGISYRLLLSPLCSCIPCEKSVADF
eukprot:1421752-Amphidinium_carterae.5